MRSNQGEFGRIIGTELEVLKRRKEDTPRPSDHAVGCWEETHRGSSDLRGGPSFVRSRKLRRTSRKR